MDLLAYVLMSNHVHLIVRSPDREQFERLTSRRLKNRVRRRYPIGQFKRSVLSQFLHRLAGASSRCIQELLEIKGRFWESDFHSRKIETPNALLFSMAYDHLNPVVQNMVSCASEYERSSAAHWAGAGFSPIPLMRRGLPFDFDEADFRRRLAALQGRRELQQLARAVPPDVLWGRSMSNADLNELVEEFGLAPDLHQPWCA
ncbi:MAG: transposase [Planctomycetota bacterium]